MTEKKSMPIQDILAPISLGELIDKITILHIKRAHVKGKSFDNVENELQQLNAILEKIPVEVNQEIINKPKRVNQELWNIEDAIRDYERQQCFDEKFIQLARSVYQKNDHRAAIKKEINITFGSSLIEEKSYRKY